MCHKNKSGCFSLENKLLFWQIYLTPSGIELHQMKKAEIESIFNHLHFLIPSQKRMIGWPVIINQTKASRTRQSSLACLHHLNDHFKSIHVIYPSTNHLLASYVWDNVIHRYRFGYEYNFYPSPFFWYIHHSQKGSESYWLGMVWIHPGRTDVRLHS